ncbi:copper chaperone [Trinickia acidisoli]|uniref:copper chaperone n=1 Tax=Trinickia acidisoli TaxID=2767482 RepID=UPI001A8FD148|nr:copper chaperone [Trinickia acidisoli]
MRFVVREMAGTDDTGRIATAVSSVDPQAQVAVDAGARTIDVDSWLYPEEFLIALYEAGYDARINRR